MHVLTWRHILIALNSLMLLLLVPIAVVVVAKIWFHAEINWQELAIGFVVNILLIIAIHQLSIKYVMHDVEIWNGQVTGKARVEVSCDHSYSCACTTESDGSESCSVCYEHPNDYDWMVYSTAGEIEVNRVDRQGEDQPPRWTKFQKEQPISIPHSFDNYVKAVPESVINAGPMTEEEQAGYPAYPQVYDLQYVNRVIAMPDQKWWNDTLAETLKTLGPMKQVNVVIVLVRTPQPLSYADQLTRAWLNGKKNDVIIVIGTQGDTTKIEWTRVIGWSKLPLFNIQLADAITQIGELNNKQQIHDAIVTQIKTNFVRTPMSDYDYLTSEIAPPTWALILGFFLSIIVSVCCSWYFYHNDVRLRL